MHTLCVRRKLLTAIQFVTIPHTSNGRRSLLTAIRFVTILLTSNERRSLLTAIQFFTILHVSSWRKSLLKAICFVTILHTSVGRRRLLAVTHLDITHMLDFDVCYGCRIYLSCRDPHLSGIRTRSNLYDASLANFLVLPFTSSKNASNLTGVRIK